MKKSNPGSFWLIPAFIAIYFVWGTTYLANLYALKAMSPFIISALRYITAGVLLGMLAFFKRLPFPQTMVVKDLAISGILMLVGGSGLVVVAEQYISSGCAAVVVATEPLWFVLLDRPRWKLYFSNKKIIVGLLTGFAGIILFAHFQPAAKNIRNTDHQLWGLSIVLIGCILWVIGTLYGSRRIRSESYNIWHTAAQLMAAGVFSALVALLNGEWSHFQLQSVSPGAWGGLGFLIIFGSLVAYLAFAWLVTVQPPAIVSTHTYINPLIAVLIGWLAAGELVAPMQLFALVIVLAGVILTQISKEKANGE